MDVECGSSGALLLRNLDILVGVHVCLETLEEDISCLLGEIELLGHIFVVNVSSLSVLNLVLVVRIFRSECLAEVTILEARIVVTVEASHEVVHVILVGVHAVFKQEGEDLRS